MADYIDIYSACTAAEAKKIYFLTTQDLQCLPYQSESMGFGTGRPTKWYQCNDLEVAAQAKHGAAGLAKKRAARQKREENQRQKEQAALKAQQMLKQQQQQPVGANNNNNENIAPNSTVKGDDVATAKALQQLPKDLTKAFRPLVTYDYMRRKNGKPWGCDAVAQVPRVSPQDFAALIGRPTDTQLKTVVKTGAWYSVHVPYKTVFGSDEPLMGRGGRYGCNSELGLDPSNDLIVKFKPSDNTLSVTAQICHVDTME